MYSICAKKAKGRCSEGMQQTTHICMFLGLGSIFTKIQTQPQPGEAAKLVSRVVNCTIPNRVAASRNGNREPKRMETKCKESQTFTSEANRNVWPANKPNRGNDSLGRLPGRACNTKLPSSSHIFPCVNHSPPYPTPRQPPAPPQLPIYTGPPELTPPGPHPKQCAGNSDPRNVPLLGHSKAMQLGRGPWPGHFWSLWARRGRVRGGDIGLQRIPTRPERTEKTSRIPTLERKTTTCQPPSQIPQRLNRNRHDVGPRLHCHSQRQNSVLGGGLEMKCTTCLKAAHCLAKRGSQSQPQISQSSMPGAWITVPVDQG